MASKKATKKLTKGKKLEAKKPLKVPFEPFSAPKGIDPAVSG